MALRRIGLFAGLVFALPAASPAVDVWRAGELRSAVAQLGAEAAAKGIAGKTIGASTSLWRRDRSGEAELHRTKTDLLVIEDGSATLVFGGTIANPRTTAPGEVRGPSIEGGETRRLGPGDIVRIPAGTPHRFVLEKGESVAYFALKLPR